MIHVGVTLPTFVEDPDPVFAVAHAADAAGLAAVFGYEHMFRTGRDGRRRPALDCWATLGAVAAETRSVRVGTLVARATLRPPAVLAHAYETLQRVSGDRALAVIGAGDHESRAENEEFGLPFGTLETRVDALADAVAAVRATGVTTWVAGDHPRVLAVAGAAHGWNVWGVDEATFVREASTVRSVNPDATLTWGGLVVVDRSDELAEAKARRLGASAGTTVGAPATIARALHGYVAAGATWLMLAPVDSSDPANIALIAETAALC